MTNHDTPGLPYISQHCRLMKFFLVDYKDFSVLQNRVPTEPSKQYIRTYSSTFCNDPIMEAVKNLSATQQNEDTAEKIENTATNSDVEHR